jgi:hypothetical protein
MIVTSSTRNTSHMAQSPIAATRCHGLRNGCSSKIRSGMTSSVATIIAARSRASIVAASQRRIRARPIA